MRITVVRSTGASDAIAARAEGSSARSRSPAAPLVTASASSSLASASARHVAIVSGPASRTGVGITGDGVPSARCSRATSPPRAAGCASAAVQSSRSQASTHVVDTPLPSVPGARYEGGHACHERVAVPSDRTQGRRDLAEANRGQVRREVHARLGPGARAREELDHRPLPHDHRFVGLVDAHGAFRSAERDRGGEPLGAQGSRRARRQHPEQRSGDTVAGDGPADAIAVRGDRRHEHVVLGGADREPPAPQRDQVGQTDLGSVGFPRSGRAARAARRHPRSQPGRPPPSRARVYGPTRSGSDHDR